MLFSALLYRIVRSVLGLPFLFGQAHSRSIPVGGYVRFVCDVYLFLFQVNEDSRVSRTTGTLRSGVAFRLPAYSATRLA